MSKLAFYYLVLFIYSSAGALKFGDWLDKSGMIQKSQITYYISFVLIIAGWAWVNSLLFTVILGT